MNSSGYVSLAKCLCTVANHVDRLEYSKGHEVIDERERCRVSLLERKVVGRPGNEGGCLCPSTSCNKEGLSKTWESASAYINNVHDEGTQKRIAHSQL